MDEVFIIGLPQPLKMRFEAAANRESVRLASVLAGLGKRGSMMLLPFPGQAVYDLRDYIQRNLIESSRIIVLPYAEIPQELDDELSLLEELGAWVQWGRDDGSDWVALTTSRLDTAFLNQLYDELKAEILPPRNALPSEYFLEIAEGNLQLIIADGAIFLCDHVAPLRFDFLRQAADALLGYISVQGDVGRIDIFFQQKGIEYAQTGGIATTLKVMKDGAEIYNQTSSVHLKKGDKTTPQAAARIYFHHFRHDGLTYIAILYAGPHPDADIERTIYL